MGLVLALSCFGCSNNHESNTTQIPNPFKSCETIDTAEELAGFEITLPQTPDKIEVIENEMIQAFYGENDNMLIRKGIGREDVSGDYNEYEQIETVDGVILKGVGEKFSLALREDGNYSFSISVENALSQSDIMELVDKVK